MLYSINLLVFGFLLLPFLALLMFSGWWVGFIVAGLILRHGTKIETLAWSGVYILVPFSAVYYPITSLPVWAQKIAAVVPMSYIFEGMRQVLQTGVIPINSVIISFILSIIYLILAISFFKASFNKACQNGLALLDEG
jgi:ABC-2 type transport system permease protein